MHCQGRIMTVSMHSIHLVHQSVADPGSTLGDMFPWGAPGCYSIKNLLNWSIDYLNWLMLMSWQQGLSSFSKMEMYSVNCIAPSGIWPQAPLTFQPCMIPLSYLAIPVPIVPESNAIWVIFCYWNLFVFLVILKNLQNILHIGKTRIR